MNTHHSSAAARRLLGAALLGGTLVLAAGCAKNSVVGKWQGNVPLGGRSLPTTLEFKADGTETQTSSIGQMSVVANGTYVAKDANLQMTQTSITMNGQPITLPAKAATAQTVPFKLDGDTLTLTMPGQSQSFTLTRVKS